MKLPWITSKGGFSSKLVLCSALGLGFAGSVCAQGFINFDTYYNTSMSPTATANGQWWLWNMKTMWQPALLNQDVNAELWASPTGTPGSFTLLAKLLLSDRSAQWDIMGNQPGHFWDPSGNVYQVPGATTSAYFYIQAWLGNATTLWDAMQSAQPSYNGEWIGIFRNPTGLTASSAPNLTMNPAIELIVPEPGTLALAGLGAGRAVDLLPPQVIPLTDRLPRYWLASRLSPGVNCRPHAQLILFFDARGIPVGPQPGNRRRNSVGLAADHPGRGAAGATGRHTG